MNKYLLPFILIIIMIVLRFNFNYLIFHEFTEYFSVFVSFGITLVSYYTFSFTKNRFLLFLGIGYFWIGILDILHIQTYPGMPLYGFESSNITLTFWVFARLLEALVLLSAPFMRNIDFNLSLVKTTFGLIALAVSILAISSPLILFTQEDGLTTLKITFELIIIAILLLAIQKMKVHKHEFAPEIYKAIITSIIFTILSEISFTLYVDLYGVMNLVGHILKFISFWIILQVIIKKSIQEPLSLMQKESSTYNTIPIPSIVVDTNGTIRQINKAASELLNLDKKFVLNKSNHELFHPKNLKEQLCPICIAIKEKNYLKNYALKCEKTKKYTEYTLTSLETTTSDSRAIVQVSVDITSKMQMQEDIINKNELFQNIIDSAPIRIFWKDTEGKYLGANNMFLQDASLNSIEELIGKDDLDMVWSKTDAQIYMDDDAFVMKYDAPKLQYEEKQTGSNGKIMVLSTSKIPLKSIAGKTIGILGIYEDITYRRSIEATISIQNQQLIQQNRLAQMGEMISMIAHQWRQPLNAISLTTNNLSLKCMLDDVNKEYFEKELSLIDDYSQHLSKTIDDFRSFFKQNKNKDITTLKQLLLETLNIVKPSIKDKSIKIVVDLDCDEKVQTYSSEVKQVILNVIKNAEDALIEKKIPNPTITIKTMIEKDNCILFIKDNAGGVPLNIIDNIFDPYFSTKLEKDGSGLGLYMSKTIIEEHCDGELHVENDEDGAVFSIRLNAYVG